MNKTPISKLPEGIPDMLRAVFENAPIYDSSCSPEARVVYIEKDGGLYLKIAERGTLAREAQMTAYFHKKGLGTEVLMHLSEERDYLLTRAVRGEDLTHERYLSDPKRLCDTCATLLRALHEREFADCPIQARMTEYLALADKNYKTGKFDASLFPEGIGFQNADEAYAVLNEGRNSFKNDTLIHGDYCLPNVILDHWRFSSFIDLGNGGVGDKHVDLFWGAWTLFYNLKTDKYRDRFFDAYGRDQIDDGLLRTVAACEVFG